MLPSNREAFPAPVLPLMVKKVLTLETPSLKVRLMNISVRKTQTISGKVHARLRRYYRSNNLSYKIKPI